jgi:hypothetical protein
VVVDEEHLEHADLLCQASRLPDPAKGIASIGRRDSHTSLGPFVGAAAGGPPVVVTNHGPFTPMRQDMFRMMAQHAHLIAISESQRRAPGSARFRW